MSGKADPPAPAASTKQADPAPKDPPPRGENVAAIESKMKAGEVVNLSDLSDAIKKDKAAAQSAPSVGAENPAQTKGKGGTRSQQTQKSKNAPNAEQPSIKEQIAAGKKALTGQKTAPSKTATKNKNTGLED
jgi:hypothetical protein